MQWKSLEDACRPAIAVRLAKMGQPNHIGDLTGRPDAPDGAEILVPVDEVEEFLYELLLCWRRDGTVVPYRRVG